MRVYLASLLALAVAACGLPPSVFRSDRSSPLLTAPPLTQAAGGGVWLAPIEGAPADYETETFRARLAQTLIRREVPAGLNAAGPRGAKLLAAAAPATAAGRGYVQVWWRLEGADGAIWDAFATPVPLDFRIERPETQAAIAEVADRLTAMLGPPPPEEKAAAPLIPIAVLPAETKGFEDGQPLARAMAAALVRGGFQPGGVDGARAVVRPTAEIAPAPGQAGAVHVKIRWSVETPDGQEIGAADQANVLPEAAAVDGLTPIAADAALAAAGSVAGLIRVAVKNQESTGESR